MPNTPPVRPTKIYQMIRQINPEARLALGGDGEPTTITVFASDGRRCYRLSIPMLWSPLIDWCAMDGRSTVRGTCSRMPGDTAIWSQVATLERWLGGDAAIQSVTHH